MAELRAIRFGDRWRCQACDLTTETEWLMWRHMVEMHQPPSPGRRLAEAIIAAVERGEFGKPPPRGAGG